MWSKHEPMDSADIPAANNSTDGFLNYGKKNLTAEELAADAATVYTQKHIIYSHPYNKDDTDQTFSEWLANNRPSVISRGDGIGCIVVTAPENGDDDYDNNDDDFENSWEKLKASGRPVNLKTIAEIAKTHGILTGKWIIYTTTGLKVDHFWSLIARGVIEGRCGISAKVTAYNPQDEARSHIISVYNPDFTDFDQVMALESSIRSLGIKCPLYYKPNIYSLLGIYRNNQWGIRSSIYRSVYDILKASSTVTEIYSSSDELSHPSDQSL